MWFMRQSHIYKNPFYYIDYCLAQTSALQFWAGRRRTGRPPSPPTTRWWKKPEPRLFWTLSPKPGLKTLHPGCLVDVAKETEKQLF